MKIRLVDVSSSNTLPPEREISSVSPNFTFFLFKSVALVKNSEGLS